MDSNYCYLQIEKAGALRGKLTCSKAHGQEWEKPRDKGDKRTPEPVLGYHASLLGLEIIP